MKASSTGPGPDSKRRVTPPIPTYLLTKLPDLGSDHERGPEQDEVLEHELTRCREQERVAVLEGELGKHHEDEESAKHLSQQHCEHQSHADTKRQPDANGDLDDSEHRNEPVGLEEVVGRRDDGVDR